MINFNVPCLFGKELDYIQRVFELQKYSGDGFFSSQCAQWFLNTIGGKSALITSSCTHSLELSSILLDIKPGDEVIMPSYTFSSTANAFALRGARLKFVDINPVTMNIDEKCIEQAITPKTKAVVVMHYGGVACAMDEILALCSQHNLSLVEDAAQAILAKYRNTYLGTLGDFGCFSFHETKNIQCGEGGAFLVNKSNFQERAEIIREKGTNRSKFFRGEINKYGWVDIGSSFLLSELSAAFLFAQLEVAQKIIDNRIQAWNFYWRALSDLEKSGRIELPVIPEYATHNAHIFYIKLENKEMRSRFFKYMKDNNILSVFHYIPLHSSKAGKSFGSFCGNDVYTTKESERIARLPLYYNISVQDQQYIAEKINKFFNS